MKYIRQNNFLLGSHFLIVSIKKNSCDIFGPITMNYRMVSNGLIVYHLSESRGLVRGRSKRRIIQKVDVVSRENICKG